jgi:hypothetical protein
MYSLIIYMYMYIHMLLYLHHMSARAECIWYRHICGPPLYTHLAYILPHGVYLSVDLWIFESNDSSTTRACLSSSVCGGSILKPFKVYVYNTWEPRAWSQVMSLYSYNHVVTFRFSKKQYTTDVRISYLWSMDLFIVNKMYGSLMSDPWIYL